MNSLTITLNDTILLDGSWSDSDVDSIVGTSLSLEGIGGSGG